MANNEVIDGTLVVLGNVSVSSLTISTAVSGSTTFSGTQNFTGTATFTTGSQVVLGSALITVLTSAQASSTVTINARSGKIATGALSCASNVVYTMTVTNSNVSAADLVFLQQMQVGSATGPNFQNLMVSTINGAFIVYAFNSTGSAVTNSAVIAFQVFK